MARNTYTDAHSAYYGNGSTHDWYERDAARENSRQRIENMQRFDVFEPRETTMQLSTAIESLYQQCSYSEQLRTHQSMAALLRTAGWSVAENDADLRELALEKTDLVEPDEA